MIYNDNFKTTNLHKTDQSNLKNEFNDLPNELFLLIIDFLSVQDMLKIGLANRKFYELTQHHSLQNGRPNFKEFNKLKSIVNAEHKKIISFAKHSLKNYITEPTSREFILSNINSDGQFRTVDQLNSFMYPTLELKASLLTVYKFRKRSLIDLLFNRQRKIQGTISFKYDLKWQNENETNQDNLLRRFLEISKLLLNNPKFFNFDI